MMIDKPYYDYDYEPTPPKPKKVDVKKAKKKFRGFFSHTKFRGSTDDKTETELEKAERLQREANKRYKAKRQWLTD